MHTQKNILILNRVFPPSIGATGRVACDLALHLRRQGHKITVVTTAANYKHDQAKHMDVIRVEANQNPQSVKDYMRINKKMKKAALTLPSHDIVISMTDPPLQIVSAAKIAKKMKARHIHWCMDLYPDLLPVMGYDMAPYKYKFAHWMMRESMAKADCVISISNCMKRYLTHKGMAASKIKVIENWPDKYLLEEGEAEPLLPADKFRILYAGTVGQAHEFDAVLSAAKFFQKTDRDIEFIFTKRGRGVEPLINKIREKGIQNIKFLQPQPAKRLNALMACGDLHLITMRDGAAGELFPSKFYSACAAGRPILYVGPTQCDIHRKISISQCGATLRNNDARILINAIQNFKNNADDWFKACQASSKLLVDHNPLDEWADLIKSM
jgi:glycosyltransferase involved in cell wall biosynthesis